MGGATSIAGAQVSGAVQPSEPVPTVVTGLVAEHVIRDAEGGRVVELRRVETSRHGSRITSLGLRGGETYPGFTQMLANDALERLWLIDRARRIVHRVPLVVAGTGKGFVDGPVSPGEVFARAACEGLGSNGPTPSTWRGREVAVHECTDETGEVLSRQAFDAVAGIVVRVVPREGPIEEVRAIRAVTLGPERFLPDGSLRETDLDAFLGGPAPLASYEPDRIE